MSSSYRGKPGPGKSAKPGSGQSIDSILEDLQKKRASNDNYRERSLKIHGLVCAKCGREFTYKNQKMLTVHHKDGNHWNNPPDGSNWENLCLYCHEDEHSREMLADYYSGRDEKK